MPGEQLSRRAGFFAGALLLLAGLMFSLHFLHLRADFPNHSPWVDWAKYTDEGWYGDAAIRHFQRGTWRLPGDFNPGVALPVWPAVEALVFRFTGVGIVAARALTVCVFGCSLVCVFVLLGLPMAEEEPVWTRRSFAASAVLLMAVSPFLYVFTRMAILEPLLVLLMLLSLLSAYAVRWMKTRRTQMKMAALVGLGVALMIGTKTTAIFLLPAVAFMMADSARWQWQRVLELAAAVAAVTGVLWGVYLLWLVHRGYWGDFVYLFVANNQTVADKSFWDTVSQTFLHGMWMGTLVYPLSLALLVITSLRRVAWRDPVFVSLMLWAGGYAAFLVYHANMQPRYYLVIAVPLTMLMVRCAQHLAAWHPTLPLAFVALLVLLVSRGVQVTLRYVRHPEYTFLTAANKIEEIVASDPAHSHTVLSISGSDLSLMTGVPSICDDFGTMELEDRIAAYRPGWFVSWNSIEDDKMEALNKFYVLTRVAEFPVMDDPDRNVMIVYRLDAKDGVSPQRRGRQQKLHPSTAAS